MRRAVTDGVVANGCEYRMVSEEVKCTDRNGYETERWAVLSRFSAWKGRSRWNVSSLHSCCIAVESRGSDTREKVGRASCSLGCNCPTDAAGWG